MPQPRNRQPRISFQYYHNQKTENDKDNNPFLQVLNPLHGYAHSCADGGMLYDGGRPSGMYHTGSCEHQV